MSGNIIRIIRHTAMAIQNGMMPMNIWRMGKKGRKALKAGKNRTYTTLSSAEVKKAVVRLKALRLIFLPEVRSMMSRCAFDRPR